MFFKLALESFFILLLGNLTSNIIINWNNYNSCHVPTPIFLLKAYILTFLSRIAHLLRAKSPFSRYIKARLALFISWILYPCLIITIAQGITFYFLNKTYTPNCGPNEGQAMLHLNLAALALMILANIGSLTTGILNVLYMYLDNTFESIMGNAMHDIDRDYGHNQSTESLIVNWLGTETKDRKGLSIKEREQIYKRIVSEKDTQVKEKFYQETCSVCYEDFKSGENVNILPGCNHVFHMHCVDIWLAKSPACPMCRANVRTNLSMETQAS